MQAYLETAFRGDQATLRSLERALVPYDPGPDKGRTGTGQTRSDDVGGGENATWKSVQH